MIDETKNSEEDARYRNGRWNWAQHENCYIVRFGPFELRAYGFVFEVRAYGSTKRGAGNCHADTMRLARSAAIASAEACGLLPEAAAIERLQCTHIAGLNEYQTEMARTATLRAPLAERLERNGMTELLSQPDLAAKVLRWKDLDLGALGLAGEAGEVADLLKKHVHHHKPLDRSALVKELGDVLWYLAFLCEANGLTLEEVASANAEKLRARYPDGFTTTAANARADEAKG